MTLGLVYVAVNTDFPDHCKIGMTVRDATVRLREIKRMYGTKEEWREISRHLVHFPFAVEALVHRELAYCRTKGTEVFRCSPVKARELVLWAAEEVRCNPIPIQPRPIARPKTLAKGRGTYQKHSHWRLKLAVGIGLIIVPLAHYKPALPEWLPDQVLRTADRIERWPG